MSEVDRLSNSGLYPMLPIADRKGGGKDGSAGKPPNDSHGDQSGVRNGPDTNVPRPPKSIIDEYA